MHKSHRLIVRTYRGLICRWETVDSLRIASVAFKYLPTCVVDTFDDGGVSTMHVYFRDNVSDECAFAK